MSNLPLGFQPMLAAAIEEKDLASLRYPVIVQPKLDGIRCIAKDGLVLSRSLKPIPNKFIREELAYKLPFHTLFDGELVLRDPKSSFQDITSAVMSEDGEPDFLFQVFDCYTDGTEGFKSLTRYEARQADAKSYIHYTIINQIEVIPYMWVTTADFLSEVENSFISQGYEGIIIRDPKGPYKFGRSTKKEGYLLKLKRFVDAEAEVLGVIPLYHNANTLETDERGYAKRSSAASNLVALPKLGALKVRGINGQFKDVEFDIGSGFTDEQRYEFWDMLESLSGTIVTYKYQKIGSKDKPRCPIFKVVRKDI